VRTFSILPNIPMPSPANRQPPQWGDSAPVRHEMTARVPQPITSGDRFPRQRDHFLKVVSWRTTPTILNGPAHARQTRAEVKLEFVLSNLKGNAPGPAWAFAHVGHCWRMRMPWRIVSRMRGRRLTSALKICRAFSIELPAHSMHSIH
jgi:hypothetical protein